MAKKKKTRTKTKSNNTGWLAAGAVLLGAFLLWPRNQENILAGGQSGGVSPETGDGLGEGEIPGGIESLPPGFYDVGGEPWAIWPAGTPVNVMYGSAGVFNTNWQQPLRYAIGGGTLSPSMPAPAPSMPAPAIGTLRGAPVIGGILGGGRSVIGGSTMSTTRPTAAATRTMTSGAVLRGSVATSSLSALRPTARSQPTRTFTTVRPGGISVGGR